MKKNILYSTPLSSDISSFPLIRQQNPEIFVEMLVISGMTTYEE